LSSTDSAFSQLILNAGGTLRLSANVSQLLTTAGGNIRLQLGETGAGGVIDTNGFNTTIDRPVLDIPTQAGKLVKRGDGALTLSGPFSYTGSTTVEEGTLSLASASLADDSSVTVATGATLALNFTGTDDVAAITLGAAPPLGPGTYSASTHPGLLSGTGALRIPASDPFLAWIEPFFPGETDPAIVGRDADPDGDGIPNAIEFLTGGIPNDRAHTGLLWVGVTGNQLVLSLAIRGESTTFSANPSPAATVDGITLTVEGSTTLTAFDSPVSAIPLYVPPTWPLTPPVGYAFYSFKLDASTGLPDRGFLRAVAD
jgi:autotransporter-associated beta strand protein